LSAFTLILPLFPALISHYREKDDSGLFKMLEDKVDVFRIMVGAPSQFNNVLFGGFLGSLFSFLQFLASPVIGGLSDRFGRKPLMIVTIIGSQHLHYVTACNWYLFQEFLFPTFFGSSPAILLFLFLPELLVEYLRVGAIWVS
jgi:MFS family permease